MRKISYFNNFVHSQTSLEPPRLPSFSLSSLCIHENRLWFVRVEGCWVLQAVQDSVGELSRGLSESAYAMLALSIVTVQAEVAEAIIPSLSNGTSRVQHPPNAP